MKTFFKKLLSRSTEAHPPFAGSKQVIEFAFECGGIDYYRHVDEMNMPYKRALKALAVYKELEMKCDRYYLDRHIAASDAVLGGNKFGVNELIQLKRLNDQLRERVQWVVVPDHVYKLASVRYFDRSENPNDYDWKYAAKKIEHWRANQEMDTFFLSEPIQTLVPFLRGVAGSFKIYSEAQQQLDQIHLDSLSDLLSPQQKITSPPPSERLFWEETSPQRVS